MNLRESAGIALAALRANKLRSFLTLLGTIIGVMAVITVVSFVEGMNRFVTDKLLNAGANVFWIDKYGMIMSQEAYEQARRRPDITLADADALRDGMRAAQLVVAQASAVVTARGGNRDVANVALGGRSAGYETIDDLTIADGRHLREIDDQHRRAVCVIGSEVAEELFPDRDPLGRRVRLGAHSFEVIGVTVAKGRAFGRSQDRFALIPVRTFVKLLRERGSIEISVKSVDEAALPVAQLEARNILRQRRHLTPGQPDNFGITTADAILDLYHTLTRGIFFVAIGVAAISLVVGGIVIMNIMLVSVTERTREIGIRKAVGARRRDIVAQFLVEAATLSAVGGVIGIAVGIALALGVGMLTPLPAAVSLPAVGLGIVMSTGVGLFFGWYPAMRAARLDPIEALRYE